jgi:hypothetical protein
MLRWSMCGVILLFVMSYDKKGEKNLDQWIT